MMYLMIAWLVIGQLVNTILGIKGIVFYLLGLLFLVGLDGYQVISYMQFANVAIAATILILILLIALIIRKKIWGDYNLPIHNLFLMGLTTIFIIGSLSKPSIGLMSGGTIVALPIGRIILQKGLIGIIQLYAVTFLQWSGLFLINLYILLNIIKSSL